MKVPLTLDVRNSKMFVVANKKINIIPFPFKPYLIVKVPVTFESPPYEDFEKIRVKTFEGKEDWAYKITFAKLSDVQQYREVMQDQGGEDKILLDEKYEHLLYFENFDFSQYSQTEDLCILSFDIECDHEKHRFPDASRNIITRIGVIIDEGEMTRTVMLKGEERQMLEAFLLLLEQYDPDVLVGYNIKKFDLPYIIQRLRIHNLDEDRLRRIHTNQKFEFEEKFKSAHQHHSNVDVNLKIEGRIVADSYVLVSRDNKLRKLRSLKLVEVAQYFGLEKIKLDMDDENYTEEQMDEYCMRDVELARYIFNVYKESKQLLAEEFNLPLDKVINDYPSFVPMVFSARNLRQQGYVPDMEKKIFNYEGAFAKIWKSGLFKPIYHVDFSSMYPSIMITYNLSPETLHLVREDNGTEFEFRSHSDYNEIMLPDKRAERRFIFHIDKKPGILPQMLEEAYAKRLEMKKMYKATGDEKWNSKQNVYKLILNTTYGFQASLFARWGSIYVALATTALSRYYINLVAKQLGDTKIECDTDGIYADKKPDLDAINKMLIEVSTIHGCLKCFMSIDYTEYDSGYYYKTKNYCTLKKGKISWTGNSFVSRRQPLFIRQAFDVLIDAMLNGKDMAQAVRQATMPHDDIKAYVMHMRVMKTMDDYSSSSSLGAQIIKQWSEFYGEPPPFREQLSYVATTSGFKIVETAQRKEIDKRYYDEELKKVFERLGIKSLLTGQSSLKKWL